MDVIAHLLTWNGEKYLADLFASLDQQSLRPTLRVVDNGSTDGSVTFIHERASQSLVARNVKNLGFAGGHNQLFTFTFEHLTEHELAHTGILLVNQDMVLDRGLVEQLAKALEADPTLAAVQPKIYRAFRNADEVFDGTKSDVLDTTGLELTRSWRFEDRGAGEIDHGQFDAKADLIGACGALVMFRASALKEVTTNGEVFDGDFFAYREDCDLALRLKRAGWNTAFVPTAKAWHYRGMFGAQKRSWFERLRDRQGRSPFLAALAQRNQLLMLIKNLPCSEVFRSGPFILFHEVTRLTYSFFFERETRKLLLRFIPFALRALKKRKAIFGSAKVPSTVFRKYVVK
ncbi:MAG: glycosyltransferase family 2 protein [Patescibacteria group bacterium]|jgi:GT2 family glycosyltransferase